MNENKTIRRGGTLQINCPHAGRLVLVTLVLASCVHQSQTEAQVVNSADQQQQPVEVPTSQLDNPYPYYLQSPLQQTQVPTERQQRANTPTSVSSATNVAASPQTPAQAVVSPSRNLAANNYQYEPPTLNPQPLLAKLQPVQQQQQQQQPDCLYDKRHFAELGQCLGRKPYPTVGLPAFKNEDLLLRRGLSDKHGCSFTLTNGLFKNYLIGKYSLESDTRCLDQDKSTRLSIQFSNVTLYYLWQLRCLNYANQLQDDATLSGKTLSNELYHDQAPDQPANSKQAGGVCVGSSQNFGFASLQLTNIEAQMELSVDIYKNWRVTNVSLGMSPAHQAAAKPHKEAAGHGPDQQQHEHAHTVGGHAGTHIKEFTFDTLDGDELNWRYLHLYENWTRNRLHVNFLDQFKRFLWISLQRCLGESAERLPVKLTEMFGSHKYN